MPTGGTTRDENGTLIRPWLLKTPQPALLKCKCLDGETRTFKVDPASKKRWTFAEAFIDDICATHVECLDAKGNTLRMTIIGREDESAPASPASPALAVPTSGNASDFSLYAKLLAQAYKDGAASAEAPTRLAFETLGQLLAFMMKKIGELDARDRAQVNAVLKAAQGHEVTPEENPLGALVTQFLTGMSAGKALNGASVEPEPEPDAEEQ